MSCSRRGRATSWRAPSCLCTRQGLSTERLSSVPGCVFLCSAAPRGYFAPLSALVVRHLSPEIITIPGWLTSNHIKQSNHPDKILSIRRLRSSHIPPPQIISAKDPRVRSVPFPTRRPTLSEVARVYSMLMAMHDDAPEEDVPVARPERVIKKPVVQQHSSDDEVAISAPCFRRCTMLSGFFSS